MLLAIVGLFRARADLARADRGPGLRVRDRHAAGRGVAAIARPRRSMPSTAEVRKHPAVANAVPVSGMDPLTFAFKTNAGIIWLPLKPWDERTGDDDLSRPARSSARCSARARKVKDAFFFAVEPPPIEGLSMTRRLRGVHPVARPRHAARSWRASRRNSSPRPRKRKELSKAIQTTFSASVPQMRIDLDREKAMTLGVPVARGVRYPAEHVRRAVRERLQPLRPRVPGAAAVGAALPRVSRGHPQRLRAREVGRARAADRAREHPRSDGSGNRRALQRVHVREDHGQRAPGLQLRRCDRGDGRSRERSAAARLHARVDGHGLPGEGQRRRVQRRVSARRADGVPDSRCAVRALDVAARGDSRRAVRGVRRVHGGVPARPGERHLFPDRHADAGRVSRRRTRS